MLFSTKTSISVSGAARPKRRGRPAVRRVRRLVTGLCAGAALLGGSLSAFGQQTIAPVGYNANLRGHGQSNCCVPACPTYSYPCTPHQYAPNYYAPYYQEGAPTDAPPQEGQAGQDGQPGQNGQPGAPGADGMNAPNAPPPVAAAPVAASVSGATGSQSSPDSASVNSIGDFFGASHQGVFRLGPSTYYVPDLGNSVVGSIKAAENNSPIPQDRYFLDYSYYHNVPLSTSGTNVTRMTPGLERTFQDGLISAEIRMPLAKTLNSQTVLGAAGPVFDEDHWEAGNLYTAVKGLLYRDEALALATGMGISAPTANDVQLIDAGGGGAVLKADNHAVHLLPYFGAQYLPNETFFTQGYIQVDVDANGNPVYLAGTQIGTYQAQTLLFTDLVTGAWLYDDPNSDTLTGVAGVVEAHYTTSVSDPHSVSIPGASVSGGDADTFFATGVLGVHLFYAGGARVTFGYGLPLANDRFADGEFRMMLNFGPPLGVANAITSIGGR